MDSVSLDQYYSTTRTFDKWMINSNRELVTIPAGTVPVDYSPTSGNKLGILVEPYSKNYFIDSEGLSSGVIKSSGVSRTNTSVSGSQYSLHFNGTWNTEETAGANISLSSDAVALSFFVTMDDGSKPVLGYSGNQDTSFFIMVNGSQINLSWSDTEIKGPMLDGSYRVRVRIRLYSGLLDRIEIAKPLHHTIGFSISRIQVEKDHWTSYIPTNGTAQDRPAETIYRNLTHGVDINENQGSFDVVYSPTPGSYGSPMTLLKNDWSEYIAFGHQKNEDGYPEVIRFHTDSSIVNTEMRFYDKPENITESHSAIRASYSGYGVRGLARNATKVSILKDYTSFKNGKLNRIQFGESFDGTYFCGTIHLVNGYLRTLTDDEMINLSYTPNDSSSGLT